MTEIEENLREFIAKLVVEEPFRKEFFENREKIVEEKGHYLSLDQKALLSKITQEDFEVYLKKESSKNSIIGHSVPTGKPPGSL